MVEWKKLGDVCKVLRGKRLTKAQLNEDVGYPVLHGGSSPMGYYKEFNRKANTTVIVNTGNAGSVFFYDKVFWSSDACFSLYPDKILIDKYLYLYVYGCEHILKGKIRAGAMPTIDAKAIEDLIIPIPSLSEQTRIVGILDTFTAAIENLKQQIAERRKQYEYYRDELLDLEGKEGVEMKTLGEIGKCITGATPSTKESSYWEKGTIPWMSSGEIHQGVVTKTASFITQNGYDNASTKMLPKNTVVIALAGQGKTRGTVAITAIKLCTNQSLCGIVINDETILNKYVYFYLQTRYNDLRRISSGDGTRGGLNLKMVGSYPIPIPTIKEQSRIVSILDTFEASIANLEAQLKEREKQYEYYRNQLLTFQ